MKKLSLDQMAVVKGGGLFPNDTACMNNFIVGALGMALVGSVTGGLLSLGSLLGKAVHC